MCLARNADLIRAHNAIEMNYAKIPVTSRRERFDIILSNRRNRTM